MWKGVFANIVSYEDFGSIKYYDVSPSGGGGQGAGHYREFRLGESLKESKGTLTNCDFSRRYALQVSLS